MPATLKDLQEAHDCLGDFVNVMNAVIDNDALDKGWGKFEAASKAMRKHFGELSKELAKSKAETTPEQHKELAAELKKWENADGPYVGLRKMGDFCKTAASTYLDAEKALKKL